jgi:hypothetical protein
LALDLLWKRPAAWTSWKTAVISGVVYTALLIVSEWFFASFLMTPAAENRFFGTRYLYYALPPQSFLARNLFVPEPALQLWLGFLFAALLAVLAVRWAISRGDWMFAVKR